MHPRDQDFTHRGKAGVSGCSSSSAFMPDLWGVEARTGTLGISDEVVGEGPGEIYRRYVAAYHRRGCRHPSGDGLGYREGYSCVGIAEEVQEAKA